MPPRKPPTKSTDTPDSLSGPSSSLSVAWCVLSLASASAGGTREGGQTRRRLRGNLGFENCSPPPGRETRMHAA
eukprot:1032645-Rhodomonas_salina.2